MKKIKSHNLNILFRVLDSGPCICSKKKGTFLRCSFCETVSFIWLKPFQIQRCVKIFSILQKNEERFIFILIDFVFNLWKLKTKEMRLSEGYTPTINSTSNNGDEIQRMSSKAEVWHFTEKRYHKFYQMSSPVILIICFSQYGSIFFFEFAFSVPFICK